MRYKLWYFDVVLMVFLVFSLPLAEGCALSNVYKCVTASIFHFVSSHTEKRKILLFVVINFRGCDVRWEKSYFCVLFLLLLLAFVDTKNSNFFPSVLLL